MSPLRDGADERILILAPIGRDGALIAAATNAAGLGGVACADADELFAQLPGGAGAIVLTAEVLDARTLSRLEATLGEQPPWSDLPVVVLTTADRTTHASPASLKHLEQVANVTFLERPVRVVSLISTLRSAIRARRRQYEVRDHVVETEAANRGKDEFLAMLGHELRNPIASIVTAIRVLEQVDSDPELGRRAREVIQRQARHLGRLVDDLLDVSRVTSGRISLSRKPLELGASVARSVATLVGSQGHPRHALSIQVDSVWVDGDDTRLEQVVANLVGNALKYTPEGGTIDVFVGRDGDDAVLRVRDSGIGVPATLLPRVFDLFVQGERGIERARGGLGVGLTLVRRLVELHGGTVEVTSDGPGRGSCFTVRLPAVPAPPATPSAARVAPAASLRTVLIVEDNDDHRGMMRELLKLVGHRVHEAVDGLDAVARVTDIAPDVAVVDVGLPGLDGYEVARRIRRAVGGDKVVLVALTGYGQPEDRQRALEAGFDTFLTKPIDPEELLAAVSAPRAR